MKGRGERRGREKKGTDSLKSKETNNPNEEKKKEENWEFASNIYLIFEK